MRSFKELFVIGLIGVLSGCNSGWKMVDEKEGSFQNKVEQITYIRLPAEVKNGFSGMEFQNAPVYVCDSLSMKVTRYYVVSPDDPGFPKKKAGEYLRINGRKYFLEGTIVHPIVVCDNAIYYTRDSGVRLNDSIRNKAVFYRAEITK